MESEQFRWIGKSLPRVEDERLMRGAGRYIDDLEPFPGCKVAAIVRSPYAHAHIRHMQSFQAVSNLECMRPPSAPTQHHHCPDARTFWVRVPGN
jgi:hypothetical protein